jgi:hypothetical protein
MIESLRTDGAMGCETIVKKINEMIELLNKLEKIAHDHIPIEQEPLEVMRPRLRTNFDFKESK